MTVVMADELPKEVRELVSRFKRGYTIEETGGRTRRHYRVRDPQGNLVQYQGKNLTLNQNAKNVPAMERGLKAAKVLRGGPPRTRTSAERKAKERRGIERMRETQRQETERKRRESNALLNEMQPWLKAIGVGSVRGVDWDLARWLQQHNSDLFKTEAGAHAALKNLRSGMGISDPAREAIAGLHQVFVDNGDEPLATYVDIAREARGIDASSAMGAVELPSGREWPFTIRLVEVDKCFADQQYQRPAPEHFVREIVLNFDERLVGVIDVSARDDGTFAILDGQTRWRAVSIVGKRKLWAAIYEGMDIPAEARYFYRVNRNRKSVNIFYGFRARVLSGEPKALAITRILDSYGLKASPTTKGENGEVAAISALEYVYDLGQASEVRESVLTPVARIMGVTWKGLRNSTSNELLKGLGRFYATYADDEIDQERFDELLQGLGPTLVIQRGRDLAMSAGRLTGSKSSGLMMAKALVQIHNTGLGRDRRLDAKRLERF